GPLNADAKYTAGIATYLAGTTSGFTVGESDLGIAARFDQGFGKAGTLLTPTTTVAEHGLATAAGDLGLGTATAASPDVVVTGTLALTIFPEKGTAPKPCGLKKPNVTSTVAVPLANLLLADVRGLGRNQIVVSGRVFEPVSDQPRIVIMDPRLITDGS